VELVLGGAVGILAPRVQTTACIDESPVGQQREEPHARSGEYRGSVPGGIARTGDSRITAARGTHDAARCHATTEERPELEGAEGSDTVDAVGEVPLPLCSPPDIAGEGAERALPTDTHRLTIDGALAPTAADPLTH
jgi:hypothetical protein